MTGVGVEDVGLASKCAAVTGVGFEDVELASKSTQPWGTAVEESPRRYWALAVLAPDL